jgi:hypothetical protein
MPMLPTEAANAASVAQAETTLLCYPEKIASLFKIDHF